MKILAIAATPFFSDRGCHIRIYNEAKYLGKMGAATRLCTYHLGENVEGLDVKRIRKAQWYKKISPGFSWGKIWLDWKLLFLARREIKNFQPDVIHAHLWEGLAVGYLAKKLAFRMKIPIVFDLQGNLDEEFESYNKKNKLARKLFVWFSKIVVRWADRIVVSSENVNRSGLTPTIIRDGVDLDLFKNLQNLSDEESEKIKELRSWSGDSRLLIYIGGLSDNKGVGELLEAFSRSDLKNQDWKLLLGGYGEDEKKYKKFVEDNNLGKRIYFFGKVRYFSLPHYLALADAGIDPKKGSTESSGKLMNLLAAELPIICFDNEFCRSRLGEKGYFLRSLDDLGKLLANINKGQKIAYDLENLSEEKEARKLFGILKSSQI
jgi:glycosyltransferase involved in cell wall biosynthesis